MLGGDVLLATTVSKPIPPFQQCKQFLLGRTCRCFSYCSWASLRTRNFFAGCKRSTAVLRLCHRQVSDYWRSVIEINDYQKSRYVERVIKSMFNTVSKKKIAVGAHLSKLGAPSTSTCCTRCSVVLHGQIQFWPQH